MSGLKCRCGGTGLVNVRARGRVGGWRKAPCGARRPIAGATERIGNLVVVIDGVRSEIPFDVADPARVTVEEINRTLLAATGGRACAVDSAMAKTMAAARREAKKRAREMRIDRARLRSRLIAFVNRTPIRKLRYEDSRILIEAIKSYFAEDWSDE